MVARIRAVPIGGGLARLAGVLVGALVASALSSTAALAQVSPNATVTPVRNTGGFVYILAFLMAVAGIVVVVVVAALYLRYAPRFQRTEGGGARADRIVPGREPPRRAVDVSQAAPVVVAPPAVPAAAAAAPAPARAAPAAGAAAPAAAPAAAAPAPAAAAPAPAATREQHADVELDQEVFDAKLAELLAAGTDRRVAEGQARRAAMIAARKKAEG